MKEIITENFILRMISKNDYKEIFKILSDEKVVENLNMNIHQNEEDTKKMINEYIEEYEKRNKFPFVIIKKDTNEFVGVFLIKLDLYDEDCYEFTVYIDSKFWNKGVYSEVLPYMVKFTFENIKCGNFRGFVMEKNIASSKVLAKSGFKLEKIFKVPTLEGNILSYLITMDDYKNK